MICPTCQYSDRPGFVATGGNAAAFTSCPTCNGSRIASCCDGAVPCDEDVVDQRGVVDDAGGSRRIRNSQSIGALMPVSRSCISIHLPSTSRLIT
jgi:hypothetical protein